ncbi:matrix metalloproteinase-25 isoform X2 [Ochotona princeps]|uniref:matrix metalloproteinase-25 isoform X2 n=1 Tax=Ochotona princeps TaxID=9978 RepID=UPI002714D1AA|nr:matrix metalloproteinase-25 isoform X2 [Ochotona princeps]XP_058536709.1 matrix metalloproteinase-25 isoform X2 [Ochotona princeps]
MQLWGSTLALRLRLLALLLPLLPPPVRALEPTRAQDVSLLVDWLTRYGYLPPPDPAQAQLQSPAKLRDALKVMQRFAGLPETGFMDSQTVGAMRKPRCSLPDVLGAAGLVRRRRRYALSGSVWRKRSLTWGVRSFPQGSQLSHDKVRTLLNYALAVWGSESGLSFHEVDTQRQEPDILIDFVRAYHQDSYPFDGLGGTLAHAFFPGEHPISGDTHFDDEETWTYGVKDGEGTDLFAVAVHEFGHALGLGHSSAPSSIMRPFYQGPVGDPAKYRLSPDDLEGLQQLYGTTPVHQTPHRPTRRPLAPPPQPPTQLPDRNRPSVPAPDRCEGNFDAIANIRGETFFFKGPWFWRLQPSGQLVSPRPAGLHRFWEGLPVQVKMVQAAYARPGDGRILLFSGPQFWVFRDRQLDGPPRPLTELGLPPGEVVDAVFSWPSNGKTYLIRGQRYWRFDEAAGRADPGYPRDLSLWEGAPPAPDDVTVSNTGDTYFFKGAHYWRFPKGSVKVEPDFPQPMGPQWLDCPASTSDPHVPKPPQATPRSRACDCKCEINRAAGRLPAPLLLPLLPLLAAAVASR